MAKRQAASFFALLKLADLEAQDGAPRHKVQDTGKEKAEPKEEGGKSDLAGFGGLRYSIEIHLPATKDIEVFNAIFRSLKEHLIE